MMRMEKNIGSISEKDFCNKVRMVKRLGYLGGFIGDMVMTDLKAVLPSALAENLHGSDISENELMEEVRYLKTQWGMLQYGGTFPVDPKADEVDYFDWFASVSFLIRRDKKILRFEKEITKEGGCLCDLEAAILYYLLGKDGKGRRTPEELSSLKIFCHKPEYAVRLANQFLKETPNILDTLTAEFAV